MSEAAKTHRKRSGFKKGQRILSRLVIYHFLEQKFQDNRCAMGQRRITDGVRREFLRGKKKRN